MAYYIDKAIVIMAMITALGVTGLIWYCSPVLVTFKRMMEQEKKEGQSSSPSSSEPPSPS